MVDNVTAANLAPVSEYKPWHRVAEVTEKRTPVAHESELQSGTEEHVVIESTVDRVRGEHTTHELFSFLSVIYIFVTIQLLNVCLVLFLTLLYIRTQRWLVPKQPIWAVDIDILHILTYFIDWPFCSATHQEVKLAHALCHISPHQFYIPLTAD